MRLIALFCILHLIGTTCAADGPAAPPADLGVPPPEGAIVLFDGKDTSAWAQHAGMRIPPVEGRSKPCHYRLIDGALEVVSPGHLITRRDFGDVRMHVEFMVAPGIKQANSGIWFAFRYGVEIRGPGDYLTDRMHACGALYGVRPPPGDFNRPLGEWQSFDITFRTPRFDGAGKKTANARFTVIHNGQRVHEEFEIPKTMPTLVEPEAPSPGPIVLENHGTPIRFRNIWVLPLAGEGTKPDAAKPVDGARP